MTTSNQHDRDIPVLTDIIDSQEFSLEEEHAPPSDAEVLAQIEEEITLRIFQNFPFRYLSSLRRHYKNKFRRLWVPSCSQSSCRRLPA